MDAGRHIVNTKTGGNATGATAARRSATPPSPAGQTASRATSVAPVVAAAAMIGGCCGLPLLATAGILGAVAGLSVGSWLIAASALMVTVTGWARWRHRRVRCTLELSRRPRDTRAACEESR